MLLKKNGTRRLAQHKISTNLRFVKIAVSVKHDKAKDNKTRYACKTAIPNAILLIFSLLISYVSQIVLYHFIIWIKIEKLIALQELIFHYEILIVILVFTYCFKYKIDLFLRSADFYIHDLI